MKVGMRAVGNVVDPAGVVIGAVAAALNARLVQADVARGKP